MKNNSIIIFSLFILFSSCKKEEVKPNFEGLFNQAYSIIKTESIKKEEISWTLIEKKINDSIPTFRNNNDAYKGIVQALDIINDKHSFFLYPKDKSNFLTNDSIKIPEIKSRILKGNIGYLKILGFAGNDSLSSLYSSRIKMSLKRIDTQSNLSGWIIDLRNNKGGRIGMMPLGISLLYQDSIIGLSYKKNEKYLIHKLINNKYFYGSEIVAASNNNDTLYNKNRKIAVLVNANTASAAEFTAQSLKFQNKTKIFGTKTKGLTSDVMTYKFKSGAILGITNAHMCNKNKEIIYGITPDIECKSEQSLELAIEWINNAI